MDALPASAGHAPETTWVQFIDGAAARVAVDDVDAFTLALRRTCCLAYETPHGYCASCSLLDCDERVADLTVRIGDAWRDRDRTETAACPLADFCGAPSADRTASRSGRGGT
ncbi:MAG: (2Fe-2S)-binding protein [Ilumatobacteraceae bacterium]|nr:(2Fe-2S)-binding protein [Ilumatobacteraceae bacterium]